MVQVLLFSSLYPNTEKPGYGIFVEGRLKKLLEFAKNNITVTVIAPLPVRITQFFSNTRLVKHEKFNDIDVFRPRFIALPIVGRYLNPLLMFISSAYLLRKLKKTSHSPDLIDAHYMFPDGVAAVLLARVNHIPVVVTARGSDINFFPKYYFPRLCIKWAAKHAAAIITVSEALRSRLIELNVPENKITTLKNGVDLRIFHYVDKDESLDRIDIKVPFILSVGNLVEIKGHELVLRALKTIPDLHYVLIGDGPMLGTLKRLAIKLEIQDRVNFVGAVKQSSLKYFYNAAKLFVLPSRREGMPNVVLESIACGTPVVATSVGGLPEIIQSNNIGLLVESRNPYDMSEAILRVLNMNLNRDTIRQYANSFNWDSTSKGQISIFEDAMKFMSER